MAPSLQGSIFARVAATLRRHLRLYVLAGLQTGASSSVGVHKKRLTRPGESFPNEARTEQHQFFLVLPAAALANAER